MARLPVIVGFGGINAAGRSSGHHAYKRIVIDALSKEESGQTYLALATMMGKVTYQAGQYKTPAGKIITSANVAAELGHDIREDTLIRKISPSLFDTERLPFNHQVQVAPADGQPLKFVVSKTELPANVPHSWLLNTLDDGRVEVTITDHQTIVVPEERVLGAHAAGAMPEGFEPGNLYYGGNKHPRALQMSVYATTDALGNMGIPWETIQQHVAPDQVSVYATSLFGQVDEAGFGGMFQAWLKGKEPTNKQAAFGLAHMPADFVNSYVTGTLGATGAHLGACATFLYNLEHAIRDIQNGLSRVAIVGTSEAPITPEMIEGFRAAGALGDDAAVLALDAAKGRTEPDLRRPCRPFGYNCGLTMAESSQFIVLMDDQLALELGAVIYGAIPNVYVNADGYKKSVYAPGAGNYLTFAKTVAAARNLLGEEDLRNKTFIQAHGTGTPLNRKTESLVFDRVATAFGIHDWPVVAIKCYLGHTMASASGDQITNTLGIWQHGILPGIFTLDELADDVYKQRLSFSQEHREVGTHAMDAAILNTKGFGGNNASCLMIAPQRVEKWLRHRYAPSQWQRYEKLREQTLMASQAYDQAATRGEAETIYRFNHNVIGDEAMVVTDQFVDVPGIGRVNLDLPNMYEDMLR